MNNKTNPRINLIILSSILILILSFMIYINNSNTQALATETNKQYSKEIKEKNVDHATNLKNIKNIEKDQEFWNYLKTNHTETYNLLNSIKDKQPKMYKKLLRITGRMYMKIKETGNQELKNIFADQINNQTKLTQLMINHKEGKVKESEFDTQAKQILTKIHDNNIRIMEIKIEDLKNRKEQKVEEMLKKIKEEIKEFEQKFEKRESTNKNKTK
ncbi:MAG: hypothetical protein RMJ36_01960 [Candidatus Calescibacterium sp.]|nr:hypothetical protein [Candidatus Calescibacterium sp.]MDW8132404.1 hypothetical protein [Candidatus Calescibacterium sp.]